MKKGFFYLLALAAAAMTISSCEQNEVNAPENHSKDGFRYEFVINDEGAIDESTKAALSSTGVAWEANDRVGMFLEGYTGYAEINMENDPRTVILYSNATIPANSYAYAYYPYSTDNTDKDKAKIVIPHVQSGASQSAMPLAGIPFKVETEAEAKSRPNGEINFMNLGSIIDFKVYSSDYDDEVVDYITFTATNSGVAVAGDGYLDLTAVDQNDPSTLVLTFGLGDDYDNVKVHNANTAVASTKDAASSIYMVLNPGTYSGTITIGTDKATYTFNYTDKTLVRNQLKHYNMNLNNASRVAGVVETVMSLPYSEPFTTDAGEFVVEDISNGDNFTIWSHSTQNGTYMKATGFESSTSRHAAESRLVSPWIDLTGVSHAYAQFDHAHRYAGTASTELTFWVLTDATNATWQKETIPTYAAGNNWTFVNSGEIDLSAYAGNKVKIAFKYISDGTSSGTSTWEINNVYVAEKVYTTEFTMDSDEITVEVGKTKNNNVTVNSGATITYSSDDESIAIVAADGTITGVAEGDTYINVHVDANGGYPAKDDMFEVHVIPAIAYNSFTWDLSTDQTVSASTEALNWNYRGVTMAAAKGTATTNTNSYYPGSGRTSTRFYSGSTLTITPYSGSTIGYVEFTATTNGYATALKNSTWSNASTSMEDGNDVTLVTVTPDNGNNAFSATIGATCGFTAVTVYYTGDLGPDTTTYSITFGSMSNGSVTASKSTGITAGESITLTISPDSNYELNVLTVDNSDVTSSVTNGEYTFNMPAKNINVGATFKSTVVSGGYTLTPVKSSSNTAYATNYDVVIDGIKWNAPGNQNFDGYWRIGGKKLSEVNRVIYGKTAIEHNISSIIIKTNGVSNANLTVNSITVTAHATAALAASGSDANAISFTTTDDMTFSKSTAKNVTFTKSGNTDLSDGYFYRIVFNFSNTTNSNYGLDLTEITFN